MMRLHLSPGNLIEDLRASFWALPVAGLLVAAVLATVAHLLDTALFTSFGEAGRPAPNAGGFLAAVHVDTVRQVLATLATSAAGVTGIAFSVTITTLALASQQFGPHVLRTYMQRRFVQFVLAAFVGTVLYAMLALHWLGAAEHLAYQPVVTAATTLVLTAFDLLLLVLFVHTTATSIQVDSLIDLLHEDYQSRLQTLFPGASGDNDPPAVEDPGADGGCDDGPVGGNDGSLAGQAGTSILADGHGYLQSIDRRRLVKLATEHDLRITVAREPGSWVAANALLATVHAPTGGHGALPDERTSARVERRVRQLMVRGSTPTPEQDPRFALRQLQQIALRALSPALNDPYTANSCIVRIGAIAGDLLERTRACRHFTDDGGTVRLVEQRTEPGELLQFAFDAVTRAAGGRADTGAQLVHTLNELIELHPDSAWLDRLDNQLERIEAALEDATLDHFDAGRLKTAIRQTRGRFAAARERA